MLPTDNWRIQFDERYPIYQQIINRFCHALVNGDAAPGDRIPSIREMALLLKVNTNTIQRAYQEMERRDLIFSQRGTGYFVKNSNEMIDRVKDEMVRQAAARFLEEMRALGYSDTQILSELEHQLKGGGADAADDGNRA